MFKAVCPYCGEKMEHVIMENEKSKILNFGFACPNDRCLYFISVIGIPYETYEEMYCDATQNDSYYTGVTMLNEFFDE